jgi:hypothetical protein
VRGVITMPRTGAWHASLWVDSQVKPAGKVEIKAGALTLVGTVNRASLYRGLLRLRVVAGGDGLRKRANPKHYTTPVIRLPLGELARDAGEAISPTSDSAALNETLLSWTTVGVETGAMISALVSLSKTPDIGWRMLADGSIWVGVDAWPESDADEWQELEESPEDGSLVLGMDVPRLIPGTTLDGRRIDTVEHTISPEEYRAKIWAAEASSSSGMGDRFKGPLLGLTKSDPLGRYSRMYRARVLAQSDNRLKVDVEPEDTLLPLMSNIPLRHGVPGLTVGVAAGAYVMIGWENGRPDLPFAFNWANPSEAGAGDARGDSGKGGGSVLDLAIVAGLLELGKRGEATEALPMFESYRKQELRVDALVLFFAQAVSAALAATAPVPAPSKAAVAAALAQLNDAIGEFNSNDYFSGLVRNG